MGSYGSGKTTKLRKLIRTADKQSVIAHTKSVVEKLAAIGCTTEEIASIVDVDEDFLYNAYKVPLARGRNNLHSALRKTQIDVALQEHNVQMLIWLGKQYLNQREPRQDVTHSGDVTIKQVLYGDTIAEDHLIA